MIINPQKIADEGIVTNLEGGEFEVQQNGIDLTIGEVSEIADGGILGKSDKTFQSNPVEVDDTGYYQFVPGKAYSIMFQQHVEVPKGMCASIVQRSTLNRMGGYIIAGLYDSGFKNQIGAILRTNALISVEKGARVAQIMFTTADEASTYDGSYQGK